MKKQICTGLLTMVSLLIAPGLSGAVPEGRPFISNKSKFPMKFDIKQSGRGCRVTTREFQPGKELIVINPESCSLESMEISFPKNPDLTLSVADKTGTKSVQFNTKDGTSNVYWDIKVTGRKAPLTVKATPKKFIKKPKGNAVLKKGSIGSVQVNENGITVSSKF